MEFSQKQFNIINYFLDEYLQRIELEDYNEAYKWDAVKTFQENWSIDSSDFPGMLEKSLDQTHNLLVSAHYYPQRMIIQLAQEYPEDTREAFVNLFSESEDIKERIQAFRRFADEYVEKLRPEEKVQAYQDYRAITVYLTLRYPEKYYFYKSNMVDKFYTILNLEIPKDKLEKLLDYWEMFGKLKQILIQRKEFSELFKEQKGELSKEAHYNLLTHDFIWIVSTINFWIGGHNYYIGSAEILSNTD